MARALLRAARADPRAGRPRHSGGPHRHLDSGGAGADAVLAIFHPQCDRRPDLVEPARVARLIARPSLQADRTLYRPGERRHRGGCFPAVADEARASVRAAESGLKIVATDPLILSSR